MTAYEYGDEPWMASPPELAKVQRDAASEAPVSDVKTRLPLIDWHQLWLDDDANEEWIIEPLLPARRLISCYSAPKVGKSLLLLEISAAISLGAQVLGVKPPRPFRVLYVDFENDPRGDIRERLQSMNYGPGDLANLCYLSFPTIAGLDSERGSVELLEAIRAYECEVVIIDTVSRSVVGDENENDTWLNFYRHTGLKLKQAGVSMIRLDHTGKDALKGQRGGSAKSGDVDAVWRLSKVTEDTVRLDCEANRMPIAEKTIVLKRVLTPHLHHKVEAEGRAAAWREKVEAIIELCREANLATDAGAPAIRELVRSSGLKAGNDLIADVSKKRKLSVRFQSGQPPLNDLSARVADNTRTQEPETP